ncbi:MAG: ParB N-terminal domain-containing protein [Bacteroidia bacterium]
MPGRNYNANQYDYGFNGMLKDDEITGNVGTHYSAEYWEYDSRIGKRWNTDPIVKPWESPYACFSGNPIFYSDPTGETATPPDKILHDNAGGEDRYVEDANGKDLITHEYGYYTNDEKTGFVSLSSETAEQKAAGEKFSQEANAASAQKRYDQLAFSRSMSHSMDQFEKGFAFTAIAGPAAVFAAESGLAIWLLRTAGIAALEELAGVPNPVSSIEKQTIKQVEKKLIQEGVEKLNPFELIPTHSITKSKTQFNKLKIEIKNAGEIKESIKYVEHHGKKYVVDGHHRLKAAKQLGMETVPAEKVSLPYGGFKTVDDLQFSDY